MTELVDKAILFATQAHGRIDQRRLYTGQPYDAHLRAVAGIVATVTDDQELIAAAWLHDVVEDTPATFDELEREFGVAVMRLVAEVTDISRPSDGNRATRRAMDREHLAQASARGMTIKLADLIDNCADICRHDERFGRTFLREMEALLDVLGDGAEQLIRRARKVHAKFAQQLGLEGGQRIEGDDSGPRDEVPEAYANWQLHGWRVFARAFTALDIAEPLRSYDDDREPREVLERMDELGLSVVGIRRAGLVTGIVHASDLRVGSGSLAERARPIDHRSRIAGDGSLTEVIRVLTMHEHGFVTSLGQVSAVVTRKDVQKPLVRMWLFGMITLVEMRVVERIHKVWPDGSWTEHVSAARLEMARELAAERERRGQSGTLLDCLQLADKVGILIKDEHELERFGLGSKKAAKRVTKELQSLRNNLAHSQDIITNDWAQIARMTGRIETLVSEEGAG